MTREVYRILGLVSLSLVSRDVQRQPFGVDKGVRPGPYGSNSNMLDPNIDNICKWRASKSLLLGFNAHNKCHSLCDPFFELRDVHSAFCVKESCIDHQKCLFALRNKIFSLLPNLYEVRNHLVDEGLSTIGKPDVAHPKLILGCIFWRPNPDPHAGITWSDCSRLDAYMFRLNALGVCFAFPDKYSLTLDEIDVRGLRGR